jgi:hypothetical protein
VWQMPSDVALWVPKEKLPFQDPVPRAVGMLVSPYLSGNGLLDRTLTQV